MDAIEIVSTNRNPVNAFCIVSSDSDYYSLALRLREHGMYVAGIGRQGTKKYLSSFLQSLYLLGKLGRIGRFQAVGRVFAGRSTGGEHRSQCLSGLR